MLQNAYLLAKIGADTAENERNFAERLPKFGSYPTGLPERAHARQPVAGRAPEPPLAGAPAVVGDAHDLVSKIGNFAIFEKKS